MQLLRRLAARQLVGLGKRKRELCVGAVDAGHDRFGHERCGRLDERTEQFQRTDFDVDAGGREHDVVGVTRARIGDLVVQRMSAFVPRAKLVLVLREWTLAGPCAFPRSLDLDIEGNHERAL